MIHSNKWEYVTYTHVQCQINKQCSQKEYEKKKLFCFYEKLQRFPKQLKQKKHLIQSSTLDFCFFDEKRINIVDFFNLKLGYYMLLCNGACNKKLWQLSDFIPYGYNIFQTTADSTICNSYIYSSKVSTFLSST